jgi:group I intron endonuclease
MADAILAQGWVYQITNTANGRMYVGSTVNLKKRWSSHRRELRKNGHVNGRLQNAYNKYGAECFRFSIVELVSDTAKLLEREQFWIDNHKSSDKNIGYNIAHFAGPSMAGRKHTPQARRRMSAAGLGKAKSPEFRRQISEARMGHEVSAETREKISAANLGRRHSEEARQNMSRSKIGKKHSASTIEKMRAHKITNETRAKMAEALRGKPKTAEHRAKLSAANIGKSRGPQSPEVVAKRVAATRATKMANKIAKLGACP